MTLTTIPIQTKTRDKLKDFAKKSESWDQLMNRLHDIAITSANAEIFISSKTYTGEELLKRIDNW